MREPKGAFRTLLSLVKGQTRGSGEIVGNNHVGDLTVSTVWVHDLSCYETAVGDDKGFHPIARYDDRDAAMLGHAEWVMRVRDGQRDFTRLGYGNVIPDAPVRL